MIDIEKLVLPVSEDDPTGENTEYTDLAALERLVSGTPEGEEPDWRKVASTATDLLGRSKDLRAACLLTAAELNLRGLGGLAQGLQLTAQLLDSFWDKVHPQLDESDDNDSTERRNALAFLNAPTGFINLVRKASLVESRAVGRYTGRDLDMVLGRLPVPEGTNAPTAELLAAAWQSGDAAANTERANAVDAAIKAVASMEAVFRREASWHPQPDFNNLRQTLKRFQEFFQRHQSTGEAASAAAPAEPGAAPVGVAAPVVSGVAMASQAMATRGDAIKVLSQVAEFLRKTEPSSPAPMFVDRAIKLLQMDFASIVKELMPDSKERIELLVGISLDPPESSDSY